MTDKLHPNEERGSEGENDPRRPTTEEQAPETVGALGILPDTIRAFLEDDVIHWGASLAYYSLISLAPLVLLALTIFGRLASRGKAEEWILEQVRLLAGPQGTATARTILDGTAGPELGSWGAILTVALLLFGATAVFTNLQGALNRIWGVQAGSTIVRNVIRTRIAAFFMVLSLGGLVAASVIFSTLLSWAGPLLGPLQRLLPLVRLAELLTSVSLLWLFVSAAFKILPDVKISWRDVWVGALATALLLYLGKFALAAFLARNAFASLYGTAGSLFLLMMWVYFSAQVFFLGAEFTQAWARYRGRNIRPEDYAFRARTVALKEPRG